MRRRRLPCWSCGRPTAAAELVETHVRAGHTNRSGWWLSADRVIWLCPGCAPPCSALPAPIRAKGGDSRMPPIQLAHLLQVLALLLPAAVIGLVVAARLRRRHAAGTFYRRLNGAGVFTCGQCHATWPAASRRDGLATARIHAATDHAHRSPARR